jgi:hypothetical protein
MPAEDSRDAEIRELRAQLAQLQIAMNSPQPRYNLRSQGQVPVPSWGNPHLPEMSGFAPEPSRGRRVRSRKGRGQQSNGNYWTQYGMSRSSSQAGSGFFLPTSLSKRGPFSFLSLILGYSCRLA